MCQVVAIQQGRLMHIPWRQLRPGDIVFISKAYVYDGENKHGPKNQYASFAVQCFEWIPSVGYFVSLAKGWCVSAAILVSDMTKIPLETVLSSGDYSPEEKRNLSVSYLIEVLKKDPLVKKNLYEYTQQIGTTTVYPIEVWLGDPTSHVNSGTITLQWTSRRNIYDKFIERIVRSYPELLERGIYDNHYQECWPTITFYLKPEISERSPA